MLVLKLHICHRKLAMAIGPYVRHDRQQSPVRGAAFLPNCSHNKIITRTFGPTDTRTAKNNTVRTPTAARRYYLTYAVQCMAPSATRGAHIHTVRHDAMCHA